MINIRKKIMAAICVLTIITSMVSGVAFADNINHSFVEHLRKKNTPIKNSVIIKMIPVKGVSENSYELTDYELEEGEEIKKALPFNKNRAVLLLEKKTEEYYGLYKYKIALAKINGETIEVINIIDGLESCYSPCEHFELIDLNNNGQKEIVMDVGSGGNTIYSYTKIYYIKDNSIIKDNIEFIGNAYLNKETKIFETEVSSSEFDEQGNRLPADTSNYRLNKDYMLVNLESLNQSKVIENKKIEPSDSNKVVVHTQFETITADVDEKTVDMPKEYGTPFIDDNNKVQVPLKILAIAFNREIKYIPETQIIILKDSPESMIGFGSQAMKVNDNRVLYFYKNSSIEDLNDSFKFGKSIDIELDSAIQLIDNRAYISLEDFDHIYGTSSTYKKNNGIHRITMFRCSEAYVQDDVG